MVRPKTESRKRRPNVKSVAARGPELLDHQVILRPLVTEKGTWQVENLGTYHFQVHQSATKDVVRRAVENLFQVNVADVRTLNMKPREKRFRGRYGKLSGWKKAIVKLAEGEKIALF